MTSSNLSAAEFLGARRALAAELAVVLAAGVALLVVAPRLDDESVLQARILYVIVLALFSALLLHGVLSAIELLEWECPRCRESYCGALLFRSRCHACGHAARAERCSRRARGR